MNLRLKNFSLYCSLESAFIYFFYALFSFFFFFIRVD